MTSKRKSEPCRKCQGTDPDCPKVKRRKPSSPAGRRVSNAELRDHRALLREMIEHADKLLLCLRHLYSQAEKARGK